MSDTLQCVVYVPVLFGKTQQDDEWDGVWAELFNPDWAGSFMSEHHTPHIVKRLEKLRLDLSEKYHIRNWGVVGMCMTGGFPLALMDNSDIKFVVCAQPASPLIFGKLPYCITPEGHKSLGISTSDLDTAKKSNIPIFYLRFEHDKVSPIARMVTLKHLFGDKCDIDRIEEEAPFITGDAHDTLTYPRDLDDPRNPVNKHVEQLMAKLRQLTSGQ